MNKKLKDTLLGGFTQNPVFILVLGMCSTLSVASANLMNAITMGALVTIVTLLSNTIISLLRKVIPDSVRIPSYIIVIATLVTILGMFMEAYMNDMYKTLGVFIPLIVVNCIIFARAEGFAKNNSVGYAALDGLSMGVGYTFALFCMAFVRELFGLGTLFGQQIWDFKIKFFQEAPGSFMTLALLIAAYTVVMQAIKNRKPKVKAPAEETTNTEVTE